MASAQVMSNSSRKQGHLEAGKRRLEEFRKKKAAAKKAASTISSQPCGADSTVNEKQASENGHAQISNPVGVATDLRSDAVSETSGFMDHNDKSHEFPYSSGSKSVAPAQFNGQSDNFVSPDLLQVQPKQEGNNDYSLGLNSQTSSTYKKEKENSSGSFGTDTREGMYIDVISSVGSVDPRDDSSNYLHSTFQGVEGHLSSKDISFSESLTSITASRYGIAVKTFPEAPATNLSHNKSVQPTDLATNVSEPFSHALELKDHLTSGMGEIKLNTAVEGNLSRFHMNQASDSSSPGFDYSATSKDPLYPSVADTYVRRSRPSFLDSLNIGRDSPASGPEKETYTGSLKFLGSGVEASSPMQEPSIACAPIEPLPTPASSNMSGSFFGSAFMGQKLFNNSLENELETTSRRQNEDFAALEQHIEDLTQDKFSLQRALDASKTLAESLATENSSLTESYNQQASMVNQLKMEIESLQREIKARLVELEATKAEYMNAQLECNAADERAKLLASEVIGLEEKALRLRSNELKLEKELENASAQIASYKKKMGSIEKERQDLLQTIDALQEEKRLLHSKFRKASLSGNSTDNNRGHTARDASTSTNDLDLDAAGIDGDNSELALSNIRTHEVMDDLLLLLQNRPDTCDDLTMIIPTDQVQMIQNINSLISEIKVEKDELMQALVTEVSTSTRLKDLNKELSHKLVNQTQRLELLTAQSMASESTSTREPTSSHVVLESVAYADEGDEVVERVLGWIMKLFPGGASKRRPNRL